MDLREHTIGRPEDALAYLRRMAGGMGISEAAVEPVLSDPRFAEWPASTSKHHCEKGGLLVHTAQVAYTALLMLDSVAWPRKRETFLLPFIRAARAYGASPEGRALPARERDKTPADPDLMVLAIHAEPTGEPYRISCRDGKRRLLTPLLSFRMEHLPGHVFDVHQQMTKGGLSVTHRATGRLIHLSIPGRGIALANDCEWSALLGAANYLSRKTLEQFDEAVASATKKPGEGR